MAKSYLIYHITRKQSLCYVSRISVFSYYLKEAEKQEKDRASTLDTLTKLSDVSVGKAQQELQGLVPTEGAGKGDFLSKNKNLLIYGGIGVGALIVIALILRK